MALIDIDGTVTGSATATGSLAVMYGLSESLTGGSSSSLGGQPVQHDIVETIIGVSNVSGNTQGVFNMSGFTQGQGNAIAATILDAEGFTSGGSSVIGTATRVIGVQGFTFGGSLLALSVPEPIIGAAIVTANMEVIHVGYPICQTPQVNNRFRWGHQFVQGDLDICILAASGNPLGPVCITFTMFQIQRGCQPLQKGPSGRHPGKTSRVGCYYATGTAGECGQPGLWLIRWRYQGTFGGPWVEKDCYFYVLDSVLCPVPGDTLKRECKYGWD